MELENFERSMQALEDSFNELKNEFENYRNKESQKTEDVTNEWVSEYGDDYYYVDLDAMIVDDDTWSEDNAFDNTRLKHKIIFKTKQEAEEWLEYLEAKEKAQNEFSKEEWKNFAVVKYYIFYNYKKEILDVGCCSCVRYIGHMYFRSENDAQEFIDKYEKCMRRELGV